MIEFNVSLRDPIGARRVVDAAGPKAERAAI